MTKYQKRQDFHGYLIGLSKTVLNSLNNLVPLFAPLHVPKTYRNSILSMAQCFFFVVVCFCLFLKSTSDSYLSFIILLIILHRWDTFLWMHSIFSIHLQEDLLFSSGKQKTESLVCFISCCRAHKLTVTPATAGIKSDAQERDTLE